MILVAAAPAGLIMLTGFGANAIPTLIFAGMTAGVLLTGTN